MIREVDHNNQRIGLKNIPVSIEFVNFNLSKFAIRNFNNQEKTVLWRTFLRTSQV